MKEMIEIGNGQSIRPDAVICIEASTPVRVHLVDGSWVESVHDLETTKRMLGFGSDEEEEQEQKDCRREYECWPEYGILPLPTKKTKEAYTKYRNVEFGPMNMSELVPILREMRDAIASIYEPRKKEENRVETPAEAGKIPLESRV